MQSLLFAGVCAVLCVCWEDDKFLIGNASAFHSACQHHACWLPVLLVPSSCSLVRVWIVLLKNYRVFDCLPLFAFTAIDDAWEAAASEYSQRSLALDAPFPLYACVAYLQHVQTYRYVTLFILIAPHPWLHNGNNDDNDDTEKKGMKTNERLFTVGVVYCCVCASHCNMCWSW